MPRRTNASLDGSTVVHLAKLRIAKLVPLKRKKGLEHQDEENNILHFVAY